MIKNIAVIDADSIIYHGFHPNKVLDKNNIPVKENGKFVYVEKTLEEIKDSLNDIMNTILTVSKATHYICYVKGTNTIKKRLDINPEYKGNRSIDPPKYWAFAKQYLIDKWKVIEANNYEVDDYVNVTRLALEDSYIVALDGDLLGLETFKKDHFNWRKLQWVFITGDEAKHKFWSDMICGQPGDNIKGIPGKGKSYVKKLGIINKFCIFAEYTKYFGEYQGIIEFYKNYTSLKILDKIEGFIVPEPIEYIKDIEGKLEKFKLDF